MYHLQVECQVSIDQPGSDRLQNINWLDYILYFEKADIFYKHI